MFFFVEGATPLSFPYRRCWSELLVAKSIGHVQRVHRPSPEEIPVPVLSVDGSGGTSGFYFRCHWAGSTWPSQLRCRCQQNDSNPKAGRQVILRGMWSCHFDGLLRQYQALEFSRDHSRNMGQAKNCRDFPVHWTFKAIREKSTRDSNSFPARCFFLDTVCIDFQKENNTAVDKSCNFHLVFSEILLQLRYR